MKDRNYLHDMHNATSTDDGKGDIETYEYWLERQLLSRIDRIEKLESDNRMLRANKLQQEPKQSFDDKPTFGFSSQEDDWSY